MWNITLLQNFLKVNKIYPLFYFWRFIQVQTLPLGNFAGVKRLAALLEPHPQSLYNSFRAQCISTLLRAH